MNKVKNKIKHIVWICFILLFLVVIGEVDHIVPVSKGGETTEENLQTLCWRCNQLKKDK